MRDDDNKWWICMVGTLCRMFYAATTKGQLKYYLVYYMTTFLTVFTGQLHFLSYLY